MLNNSTINGLTASLLHDMHGTNHGSHIHANTKGACRIAFAQDHLLDRKESCEKPSCSKQEQDKAKREAEIIKTRMKLKSRDRGCGGCH